ncbi:MAG: acetyl-CoA C-acyltransferase [Euryarchaeota archaeon]|nr:acetyl-CoA C-acyltransferase [Euryarchaeota archaeon]
MTEVVICSVSRTPVGKFRGSLAPFSAVELGVLSVKNLLSRMNIDPSSGIIDEVIFGQVLQAGAGQAPARQVAIGAGLPVTTPALTINKVCGSSLKAVMLAANAVRSGEYSCIIAGGMESMTNAPKLLIQGQEEAKSSMVHDGLWDVYNDIHMGNTGEIVSEEYDISRETADEFALQSQLKASHAWENGWFDWETFPIELPDGNILTKDEGIRPHSTLEGLSGLKPVFQEGGRVTAGNASTLNDGASCVLVTSLSFAKEQGWEPIAYVQDYVTSGVEPSRVMAAPIPAVQHLLERNKMRVDDVDVYEHNEAFAAASCAVAKSLQIPSEKLNQHGGAVSIGHPLGSSGTRCLITMLGVMKRKGAKTGIVTLCLGGGNAVAMLIRSA